VSRAGGKSSCSLREELRSSFLKIKSKNKKRKKGTVNSMKRTKRMIIGTFVAVALWVSMFAGVGYCGGTAPMDDRVNRPATETINHILGAR